MTAQLGGLLGGRRLVPGCRGQRCPVGHPVDQQPLGAATLAVWAVGDRVGAKPASRRRPGPQVSGEGAAFGEDLGCVAEQVPEDQVIPRGGEQVRGFAHFGPREPELVENVGGHRVQALRERLGEHRDRDERTVGPEQRGPFGMTLRDGQRFGWRVPVALASTRPPGTPSAGVAWAGARLTGGHHALPACAMEAGTRKVMAAGNQRACGSA